MKPLIALILFVCTASPALAQGKPGELCADILDVHRSGGFFRSTAEASFNLLKLWTVFEADEDAIEPAYEPDFAFTTSGGIFRTINCNADDNVLELQEYFPVGTLVKPLMRLDLETGPDEAAYILVLTEYGHRKVVREDMIQYLVDGATYIFPEDTTETVYCAEGGGPERCPGNQRSMPEDPAAQGGPEREICGADRCPPGYAIGVGERGYAVAGMPRRIDGRWNALGRVLRAHEAVAERGYLGVAPNVREDFCAPFPVRGYRHGQLFQPYLGPQIEPGVRSRQEGLFLTLCTDRTGPGPPGTVLLRMVTKETARARFASLPDGAFYRRFAEENSTIQALLANLLTANANQTLDAAVTDVLSCTERRLAENSVTGTIGGGVSLTRGPFTVEATAKRISTWKSISALGENEHLRISAYIAPSFREKPPNPWLLDMVFKANCKNSTVEKPASIVIQHPDFFENHLDIGVQQMLVNQYAADHGLVGFDNDVPLSRMEAGQFFEIHDAQGYFYWRNTLPRALKRTTMADFAASIPAAADRDRMYEFYTHLLLAAVFFYTDDRCLEGQC